MLHRAHASHGAHTADEEALRPKHAPEHGTDRAASSSAANGDNGRLPTRSVVTS